MGRRRYLYGLMGFLSLLGLIGVFTPERSFLAFFAFAADFSYFFSRSDEMLEEYMNKSAALAFYWGMAAVAAVTLVQFFVLGHLPPRPQFPDPVFNHGSARIFPESRSRSLLRRG